ncbi:SWIB/MDM2 domain-containing protein [Chaetomidium leptoderma]|uniref:SWIB/MDM2 domain-containing protein n=1 Tax=Chaetomidium leptoderma TaxID=669021 RepID=A0AAN6ZW53_9PEZI|nr:SWIB/MDM2 domain-containing protein [Chaetomidium leptoderma]
MSAPLTDEERASYTRIIDGILAAADLETVTRKKIRQGLEEAADKDLSDQKNAIKNLIEARFDAVSSEVAQVPTPTSGATAEHDVNGRSPSADDTGDGEIEVSLPPPNKKQKRESSSEDADARLAAELQAQENSLSRGRVTRGAGAAKPKAKPKAKTKATKKKSAKRVRDDDDSNADDSDASAKPKRKAGGGFQKPFNLSFPLADICGENQLSRPQVVKKLWDYIKGNVLQDPSDKRQILCDEKLQAVFKQDKINMFSMNKLLGGHLYPIEE